MDVLGITVTLARASNGRNKGFHFPFLHLVLGDTLK